MSGENRDQFYCHGGFSFHDEELLSSFFSQQELGSGGGGGGADLGFEPASPAFMMGLSEYMEEGAMVAPVTPNFSVSSSSTEVGGEEDSDLRMKEHQMEEEKEKEEEEAKGSKEAPPAADNFKKANNCRPRKKGEKRQKVPRFAFVCKSEVDHLEDGYRWRKYGQKAVKNSPYPRSYYRCTAQQCNVKKRVERSHQDPSTVITTYEGQHNHYSPASMRAGVGAHFFSPPSPAVPMLGSSFSRAGGGFQLLRQVMSSSSPPAAGNPSLYNLSPGGLPMPPPLPLPAQQRLQLPPAANFGLLQDVLPSFSNAGQQ